MPPLSEKMNRRHFLMISGIAGFGSVLSGCMISLTQTSMLPMDTPALRVTELPMDTSTPNVTLLPADTSAPGVTPEASGFDLPYSADFSTLADGAPPGWFNGSKWKVVGGYLANTPTLGNELLTDPGLEATYRGGLGCITLTQVGSPILAQSADAHDGSKSQQFQASAMNSAIYWGPLAGEVGTWYQFSIWAKRIAGTTDNTRLSLSQTGGLPVSPAEWAINSPSYQQGKVSLLSTTTNTMTPNAVKQDSATGLATVVIVDDGSLKKIVKPSLYGLLPATQADVVIKIKPDDLVDNTQIGIVLRGNNDTDPANTILVLLSVRADTPAYGSLNVIKVIDSTYTSLVSEASLGVRVTDAWFEVRASGNTVSVWYNNTKIGRDLTIEDVELINNPYHGLFSAGDNRLKSFFCASQLISRVQVYAGSSFTSGPGYRLQVNAYCLNHFPQFDFTFPVLAIGGNNTWSNLVRLTTGGDVFILDHANDWTASWVEAMILRLWAANPATKIILITSPTWNTLDTSQDSLVNSPVNKNVLQDIQALAAHYEIALVDYWTWCKSVVNGTMYHLNQLTDDTVHPSVIGYAAIARLLEQYLPDGGTPMPPVLPDRFFSNSAAYQLPPIRIPGTGYTLRTGKGWTDDGTSIASSKPGDTVTYKTLDLWSSFGSWRSDPGTNVVEISVNGSEFTAMPFYQNGYDLYSITYNTITIRIPASGGNVRIEEVWFI